MGEQEVEMNNYIEVEDDEVEILDEEAEISNEGTKSILKINSITCISLKF